MKKLLLIPLSTLIILFGISTIKTNANSYDRIITMQPVIPSQQDQVIIDGAEYVFSTMMWANTEDFLHNGNFPIIINYALTTQETILIHLFLPLYNYISLAAFDSGLLKDARFILIEPYSEGQFNLKVYNHLNQLIWWGEFNDNMTLPWIRSYILVEEAFNYVHSKEVADAWDRGFEAGREDAYLNMPSLKEEYDRGYDDGYDDGLEEGLEASHKEALEEGKRIGTTQGFLANFDKWIVPAIITVLILGGIISFRRRDYE